MSNSIVDPGKIMGIPSLRAGTGITSENRQGRILLLRSHLNEAKNQKADLLLSGVKRLLNISSQQERTQ